MQKGALRARSNPFWVALLCLGILGCGGPLGPIAGGELSGEVVLERVDSWAFADAEETIALETRPDAPHSVTTWCVVVGDQLYVPSRDPSEKDWVGYVRSDPRVRVRIGSKIYERSAVELDSEPEILRVATAVLTKYKLERPDPSEAPPVAFFRLDPR